MFEFFKSKPAQETVAPQEQAERNPRVLMGSVMAAVLALYMHGNDAKAADLSLDLAGVTKRMSIGSVEGKVATPSAQSELVKASTMVKGPEIKQAGVKIETQPGTQPQKIQTPEVGPLK